jgi:hypothetical protein
LNFKCKFGKSSIIVAKKHYLEGEAWVEGILYYCKAICQDVENSNEDIIYF